MKVTLKKIDFIQYIVIDLFCGAGGTTSGYEDAKLSEEEIFSLLVLWGVPYEEAKSKAFVLSMVVACINHDPIAIKSHWANHEHVYHFEEDIKLLYGIIQYGILFRSPQFQRLLRLVELYRAFYPDAKVILWASLECTNFSKAKGGLPRDADSRTLAWHLIPYIIALDPDYIKIENVVEFMSWGPLDENGKPISRKNGQSWLQWRKAICELGYRDEWRELNAADFGALTSRNRLFGCFAKPGLPIVWPEPTHAKNPDKTSLVKPLKKWEPVKKALDFQDEGRSIFNRFKRIPKIKKINGYEFCVLNTYHRKYGTYGPIPNPMSPKSMQRFYMGCIKHIAGGKDKFLSRYYGGNPEWRNHDVEEPAGALTTNNRISIVKACFIDQRNGGNPESKSISVEEPARVLTTTGGNQQLVQASFISKAYSGKPEDKGFSSHSNKSVNAGASVENPCPTVAAQNRLGLAKIDFISRYNGVNGGKHDNSQSIENPIGALACGDNHAKVTAHFMAKYHSQGGQLNSIEEPASTITTKDRISKVTAHFIAKYNSNNAKTGGNEGCSIEEPSPTIATGFTPALVNAHFINKYYSSGENNQSIEEPSGSVLPNDKHALVTAEKQQYYIMNPSWGGNPGSIDEPCPVVIARQDKAPLYLITCNEGPIAVPVYPGDCEWTIKLKEFMALYGISDIKMRMLKVIELKVIQGFPANYILLGTQTDQKRFIGNAVHKFIVEHWANTFGRNSLKAA